MNHIFEGKSRFFRVVAVSVVTFFSWSCYSHDWPVHEHITSSAYQLSGGLQAFLNENLETNMLTTFQPQCPSTLTASNWLVIGSMMEDEQAYPLLKIFNHKEQRTTEHFYTVQPSRIPGLAIGLTDFSEPPILGHSLLLITDIGKSTNSYAWCTVDGFSGSIGTNCYKWDDARQYELTALTNTTLTLRNSNMASMLYTLGHILHLNQDASQPDHTRNEDHSIMAYIEDYGFAHWAQNPQWFVMPGNATIGWSNWQSQGFSQLLDFWDRGLYTNSSSAALIADAAESSGAKLGLAEWCNGNFLGERALYRECYKPADIHYFPYPRKTSTDFPGNPQVLTLPNGKQITNNVVRKTGDGITDYRLSILSYLGAKVPSIPTKHNTSIKDDGVLQDYHNLLIPNGVEYSTGILDYCFRGKLDISSCFTLNRGTGQYELQVTNTSGQDFKGGAFHLFFDDASSNRTEIVSPNFSTAYSTALAAGGTTTISFVPTNAVSYQLIYRGTIGTSSGSPSDPVDAGIAIAAKKFTPGLNFNNLTWSDPNVFGTGTATLTNNNWSIVVSDDTLGDYFTDGSFFYTGPAVECHVHVEFSSTLDGSYSDIVVYQNGDYLDRLLDEEQDSNGAFDYSFTIPESTGREIDVGFEASASDYSTVTASGNITPACP